ncbi:MAG TPA: YndJ family transporter, partial [Acidimicrobiales bacterium]|nr:YndJ family transporter [Acidimicrobiales bacterium]
SRLGLEPVGIGEPIVELTAVHFHFAGFAAALLAARTYEVAARVTPRWATAGTLLTIASPPVVAIGFTTGSAPAQIGGALLLSIGVWIVAALTLAAVLPLTAGAGAKALLATSALSVGAPMVLAVFWAAGQHYDVPALDVPAMARIHGTLNAFGFSLAGLLGWAARDAAPPVRRSVTA